jgi:hypothetical protein
MDEVGKQYGEKVLDADGQTTRQEILSQLNKTSALCLPHSVIPRPYSIP